MFLNSPRTAAHRLWGLAVAAARDDLAIDHLYRERVDRTRDLFGPLSSAEQRRQRARQQRGSWLPRWA
jgi:hypothetical protein